VQAATNSGKTTGQLIGAGFLQFTVLEFDNGLLGVSRYIKIFYIILTCEVIFDSDLDN